LEFFENNFTAEYLNIKTSMWHTGRSERTCRLPACVRVTYCYCWTKLSIRV